MEQKLQLLAEIIITTHPGKDLLSVDSQIQKFNPCEDEIGNFTASGRIGRESLKLTCSGGVGERKILFCNSTSSPYIVSFLPWLPSMQPTDLPPSVLGPLAILAQRGVMAFAGGAALHTASRRMCLRAGSFRYVRRAFMARTRHGVACD